MLNLKAVPASSPAAAAQYYPAAYWLSLMEMPAKSEFPGTGEQRQRHLAEHQDAGRLDPQREIGRLHRLPRARHQGDPRNSAGARTVSQHRRRVGSPREVGTGRRPDERRAQWVRPRARAEDVRGLDRPDPRRRDSAGAASARRASNATSSSRSGTGPIRRRTCTTSCRPTGATRAINANGPVYGSLELSADYTPVLNPKTNTASRIPLTVRDPEHAADEPVDARAFAVLGRRADLDEQEQRAQPDARQQGAGLADVDRSAVGESAGMQRGIEPSVGEALPAERGRAVTLRCTTRRRRS